MMCKFDFETRDLLKIFSLCTFLLLAATTHAQDASSELNAESPEEVVLSPAEAEEQARRAAEEAARIAGLVAQRDALQQRMLELQSQDGIYSPALTELYSDLGALQTELEDLDAAAEQYNQALQIARINTGLYSEGQLTILESLIDTQLRREDWQKADDLAHLHLHLHERLYDSHDERFLTALEDFGSWRLRAINENLIGLRTNGRLEAARDLSDYYGRLLEGQQIPPNVGLVSEQPQFSESWQLSLLETKTHADLTVARALANAPASYFEPPEPRYIYQTRCRNVVTAQGQTVRQCYEVRVENPRFYRAQHDAKRLELSRHTREVERNLDRMQALHQAGDDLSAAELQALQNNIDELRAANREVARSANRSLLNF